MIPDGWKLVPINELASIERGKFSVRPRNDPKYFGGNIPFVQTGDITTASTYLTTFKQTLNEDGLKVSKLFPKNTILITIAANIGETAITTFDVACTDSIVAIRVFPNKANALWLKNILDTLKSKLDNEATKNAQKNINLQTIKPLLIKTPPLKEQKKIAQIFSTWDKAITTTEQLITNNEMQKKGLMQQLLKGNKHFPQFKEKWKNYALAQIAEIIVSPVDKKIVQKEIPVKLCNYIDVYYNSYITNKINFMEATAKPTEIEKYRIFKNDVIITKDSETPTDIAKSAIIYEDLNNVVCGYHLAIIRPKKQLIDGAFLNFLFGLQQTRYYFFTLATGATRFGLSIKAINQATFLLPPLIEQQKIVKVLTTADKEIELLKQKLAYLKQEKQALMQQLLTGKKRVKVDN